MNFVCALSYLRRTIRLAWGTWLCTAASAHSRIVGRQASTQMRCSFAPNTSGPRLLPHIFYRQSRSFSATQSAGFLNLWVQLCFRVTPYGIKTSRKCSVHLHMKRFLLFSCLLLASCVSNHMPEVLRSTPALAAEDQRLALNFLHALYRPSSATHRILIDAKTESYPHGWSHARRQESLESRLKQLRRDNRDDHPLRVAIHSGDQPQPHGSGFLVGNYQPNSGRFDVIQPAWVKDRADVSMDIRHWPEGTRLISLSDVRLKDYLDDAFHLSPGSKTFRFVLSLLPPHD